MAAIATRPQQPPQRTFARAGNRAWLPTQLLQRPLPSAGDGDARDVLDTIHRAICKYSVNDFYTLTSKAAVLLPARVAATGTGTSSIWLFLRLAFDCAR